MSKRKKSKAPLIFGLLLSGAVLGGLAYYVGYGPPAMVEPPVVAQEPEPPVGDTIEVRVPQTRVENGAVSFSVRVIEVPKGSDPVVVAVNEFLTRTKISPMDARLERMRMEGSTAILEFTPEFRRTYGTDDESLLIRGIIWAVSENSGARAVVFTEGGEPIETLGSTDLTGAQPIEPWLRLG